MCIYQLVLKNSYSKNIYFFQFGYTHVSHSPQKHLIPVCVEKRTKIIIFAEVKCCRCQEMSFPRIYSWTKEIKFDVGAAFSHDNCHLHYLYHFRRSTRQSFAWDYNNCNNKQNSVVVTHSFRVFFHLVVSLPSNERLEDICIYNTL